jgi:hypothetical protein
VDHQDVLKDAPQQVATHFEVAACRMADKWLEDGRMTVSAGDLRIAREFLEAVGCKVKELPGLFVRLIHRDGHSEDMTREAAIVLAYRRLAAKTRYLRDAQTA